MKKGAQFLGRTLLFVLLTALTQIGGLVYLISLILCRYWTFSFRYKKWAVFITLYVTTTFVIVPFVAPLLGREHIKHEMGIRPTNYFTVLLNRNYVHPRLNDLLQHTSKALKKQNSTIEIRYLDANFPFFDSFPLLPHLSHNDGKKIDISLIYENKNGSISNAKKSFSGYGAFENPEKEEHDQINLCKSRGYFQYDFPKYLTFGQWNKDLKFSERGTKQFIEALLRHEHLGKLFIEPHLKKRMGLTDSRIRYHGCKAVRHDDHIHIQLK